MSEAWCLRDCKTGYEYWANYFIPQDSEPIHTYTFIQPNGGLWLPKRYLTGQMLGFPIILFIHHWTQHVAIQVSFLFLSFSICVSVGRTLLLYLYVTKVLLTVGSGSSSNIKHALHNVCHLWYKGVQPPPSVKHLSGRWFIHSHIFTVLGANDEDVTCVNNYFYVCFVLTLKVKQETPEEIPFSLK